MNLQQSYDLRTQSKDREVDTDKPKLLGVNEQHRPGSDKQTKAGRLYLDKWRKIKCVGGKHVYMGCLQRQVASR